MKNNHAVKNPRPCSFPEDDHRWPQLPPGVDSQPDPSKVRTASQRAEARQREEEAYQRFLKNRNRYKPTATGTK